MNRNINSLMVALLVLVVTLLVFSCKPEEPASELKILEVSREQVAPGEVIDILGTGFSPNAQSNQVYLARGGEEEQERLAMEVVFASTMRLSARVPEDVPVGQWRVLVIVEGREVLSNLRIVLEGAISKDLQLPEGRSYLLKGIVAVKKGVVLSIAPGVVIKGRTRGSALVVERGGRIEAVGTARNPIVFTSSQEQGSGRGSGDWGGLIIMGQAPVKEGEKVFTGLPGGIQYGGNQANDNSGVLRYVRVEFGGQALHNNEPLGGLTLAGVGSGTVIEYVQVSYAANDGFVLQGGLVQGKYWLAYGCGEDDFDVSEGYAGSLQFLLSAKDPFVSSSRGYSDGLEAREARGVVSNFTYLGGMALLRNVRDLGGSLLVSELIGGNEVVSARHGMGVFIRGNSDLKVYNSALIGGYLSGIGIEAASLGNYQGQISESMAGNAVLGSRETSLPPTPYFAEDLGVVKEINSLGEVIFYNHFPSGPASNPSYLPARSLNDEFRLHNQVARGANDFVKDDIDEINDNVYNPWGIMSICDYQLFKNPRWPPLAGRKLRLGYRNKALPPGGFLEAAPFKGAFGETDWAAGWANYDPQFTSY